MNHERNAKSHQVERAKRPKQYYVGSIAVQVDSLGGALRFTQIPPECRELAEYTPEQLLYERRLPARAIRERLSAVALPLAGLAATYPSGVWVYDAAGLMGGAAGALVHRYYELRRNEKQIEGMTATVGSRLKNRDHSIGVSRDDFSFTTGNKTEKDTFWNREISIEQDGDDAQYSVRKIFDWVKESLLSKGSQLDILGIVSVFDSKEPKYHPGERFLSPGDLLFRSLENSQDPDSLWRNVEPIAMELAVIRHEKIIAKIERARVRQLSQHTQVKNPKEDEINRQVEALGRNEFDLSLSIAAHAMMIEHKARHAKLREQFIDVFSDVSDTPWQARAIQFADLVFNAYIKHVCGENDASSAELGERLLTYLEDSRQFLQSHGEQNFPFLVEGLQKKFPEIDFSGSSSAIEY